MADVRTTHEDRSRPMASPAWSTVWRISGVLATVPGVLFVGLAAAGEMGVPAAIGSVAATYLAMILIVRRHLRELAILRQHLDERAHAGDLDTALADRRGAISHIGDTGPAADLALSLERADRQVSAWIKAAHRQAETPSRVIQAIPDPLLVVDGRSRIIGANRAAQGQFGQHIEGRDLSAVIRHPAVLAAVRDAQAGKPTTTVEFEIAAPTERTFTVQVESLPDIADHARAALLLFVDLTAVRRSEQMRVDFVANVSHELRTPLSTLMGFIETLQGPARDDDDARDRFLEIMRLQSHRMSRLVNDLLSLSRIETNEHSAPTRKIELKPILEGVKATLDLEARRKDMRVSLDIAPDLPPVFGESDELTQVLQNLMDNAIKYGRSGTVVEVSAQFADKVPAAYPGKRDGVLAIRVRDRGEGIDAGHIPRLTERFYRVDTARSRELGGTGLGLAIVKHIVGRHRGALTIESTKGEGTTVTVYLPRASQAGKGAQGSGGDSGDVSAVRGGVRAITAA
ncbi:ATP-binding protein [Thalassobaculum sp. OXR-137]|uniref:ATP-binding protein n=1 Tax=Thalassobaculum sp. OXR-137 TaxID=3100173 RepID=UPI002AC8C31A|nr:ATP-binding protein [Thalassobaculum sp. OXR-137]WPZ35566.1 ATP-binding protein [Thalassobaculum sp. OXR-137]